MIGAIAERKTSLLPSASSASTADHGLLNYDASECRLLAGRQSAEIVGVLGWRGYDDAIVTRDNLVLSEE